MTIETKFNILDEVWYMAYNRPRSCYIDTIFSSTDRSRDGGLTPWRCKSKFRYFVLDSSYENINITREFAANMPITEKMSESIEESCLFKTREDLIKSL